MLESVNKLGNNISYCNAMVHSVRIASVAMKLMFIFVGVFLFNSIQCHESGSFESLNGMELGPFYDTIIFSDIADIMKEFESSSIPLFPKIAKDDSESDENVEDLLHEYQEYLDKEHKQRKEYIEKTKIKNKVPLLRHDRFNKLNLGNVGKYNDHNMYKNGYYNLQNTHKSKNPLDLYLPFKHKSNQYNMEITTSSPRDSMELNSFKKIMLSEEGRLPSFFPKMTFPKGTSCCKSGQFMTTSYCKQCVNGKEYSRSRLEPRVMSITSDDKRSDNLENDLTEPDEAFNIRIKIDVQLPKIHDRLDNHQFAYGLEDGQKEFPLAMKMPSTLFDVPVPLNLYGYKRISKSFSSPLHKLTVHKKKKSLTGGKKHRKKLITFHNIKMDPQLIYEAHFGKNTSQGLTDDSKVFADSTDTVSSTTAILETKNKTTERLEKLHTNETQTEENVFILVNISNNDTEDSNKTNNSIETEYTNPKLNVTTENSLQVRKKRGVSVDNHNKSDSSYFLKTSTQNVNNIKGIMENVTMASEKSITLEKKTTGQNKTLQDKQALNIKKLFKDNIKKADKSFIIEDELLYWPNISGSHSKDSSKNITTIILESESKKGKLNMTKETIRKNHTRVLEKAIFGDVDWNDVEAVAPAFMSFVGKYIEGALTFCSEVICHSMKCGLKVCQHRACTPNDRFNNKGHCMGANNTDSVVTMESIMDLPTNVVFEIVDILQDKMAGKMFGKMTLCISPKCITFASSKKRFIKYKCTAKELNLKGHCVNTKEGKIA